MVNTYGLAGKATLKTISSEPLNEYQPTPSGRVLVRKDNGQEIDPDTLETLEMVLDLPRPEQKLIRAIAEIRRQAVNVQKKLEELEKKK